MPAAANRVYSNPAAPTPFASSESADPMPDGTSAPAPPTPQRWYRGVSGYQWLVLAVASAGWVFDVYEGQVFNITRNQLLADVLRVPPNDPAIDYWGDVFLGVFLVGGTFGGILFGSLADRWGRRPTMVLTILFYSLFSGLTYFATELWEVGLLRFLVAFGVGGEWAVAAALVAEVFPAHARAHASGIFHASSILGTWLATLSGLYAGENWRLAYLLGVLPALLVLVVRASVREPEAWVKATRSAERGARNAEREEDLPARSASDGDSSVPRSAFRVPRSPTPGSLRELLGDPRWRTRAVLGLLLATVGLGTFWGVTVAGQNLAKAALLRDGVAEPEAIGEAKFAYGIVQTTGGGLGLLAFGPLAARVGRRRAFVLFQAGSLVVVPVTCFVPANYGQLLILLPVFGFFTLGIHAGFAVYFPELFPTHLRATGASFCFNGGRLLSAAVLVLSGVVKSLPGMDLRVAVTLLGTLFAAGIAVVLFMPETKGKELGET